MKNGRHLLFDSSALICFGITGTLDLLRQLKKDYSGRFLVPVAVKKEIVDNALRNVKYKFQGYKLKELFDDGVLEVIDESVYRSEVQRLGNLLNSTFYAYGRNVTVVQAGEVALMVLAHAGTEDDAIVVDERTTRLLVEAPDQLAEILSNKLHTSISINKSNFDRVKDELTGISILRSTDLCLAAYLKGYLGKNKDLFDGLLWGLKFAGCAISSREIKEYSQFLR